MQKRIVTPKRIGLAIGLLLLLGIVAVLLLPRLLGPMVTEQPISTASAGGAFVDNQRCAECHAQQFQDWLGSDHEQAMKVANAQTVLGDFNNAAFSDGRVTSHFMQKDGQFLVNTEGVDGKYADFTVKYTLGIEPLQQYLLALPNGRLQAFTVAWDTKQKRWFTLYPHEIIKPGDPLHWTERGFTANSSCIDCHTTNMRLNYDRKNDSYQTTWNEINVSCQACHGPGGNHIHWAQGSRDETIPNKGLAINYQAWDAPKQVESCARCHSRRYPISQDAAYDHPFLDDFMPELLRDGLYHADGQMLDEVYNYGSFVQSKMYQHGVSCLTCHNPHTLKLRQTGNALCAGCHQLNPPKQTFPALTAKEYDTPKHHFHQADSPGAQCVNCHMPPTTYMVVDPRHDHSFSIPRPDLSLQWGTPNACTGCHADKGKTAAEADQWAIAAMDKWYGPQWKKRPNIAGIMTMARRGASVAEAPLLQVLNDMTQPAIVRATAVELLTQYGAKGMALLANQLADASPLVRVAAVRGLSPMPIAQKLLVLAPLLQDPARAVRIEAAAAVANVPPSEFKSEQKALFDKAVEEYKAAQLALPDHPEGHLNLGNLYANLGQTEQAEAAYQTAVARGHHFPPAHTQLATFYYQAGRFAEAEQTFQRALQAMPEEGSLYYSFGLFLVQQQRLAEAATNLTKATALLPNDARLFYNYGLLLQKLGQMPQAETALRHAADLTPDDQDTLLALATFYAVQKQWQTGLPYAERLNALRPNVPQFINLLDSMRKESQQK